MNLYNKIGNEYKTAIKNEVTHIMGLKICILLKDLDKGKETDNSCKLLL